MVAQAITLGLLSWDERPVTWSILCDRKEYTSIQIQRGFFLSPSAPPWKVSEYGLEWSLEGGQIKEITFRYLFLVDHNFLLDREAHTCPSC